MLGRLNMKIVARTYLLLLALSSLLITDTSMGTPPVYCNPLEVKSADVSVLYDEGVYYLYATGSQQYPGNVKGNPIWSSTDLVNWHYRGHTFSSSTPTWGEDGFWGAECIRKGSTYYLFYSCVKNISGVDTARICVAQGSSPIGPFTEIAAPLFGWGQYDDVIDAGSFVDNDSQVYLYFTVTDGSLGNCIYVARVASNMLSLVTTPQLCVYATEAWEYAPEPYVTKVNEGGFVVKHNGTYYLMYSGSDFRYQYAVGYATASNPFGPWTKYGSNPVLSGTANVKGPGSHCVAASPDGQELFIVYHSHLEPDGYVRQLNIDRMSFVDNGGNPDIISVAGPTSAPQPYPSGSHFTKTAISDYFDDATLDTSTWTNIWGQTLNSYPLSGGKLPITLENGCAWQTRADGENIILQNAPDGNWEISARVTLSALVNFEAAFLTVWQDSDNYIMLNSNFANGKSFEISVEQNGIYTSTIVSNTIGNTVYLKIARISDTTYRFYTSPNGSVWNMIGSVAFSMQDIKVGLGAWLVDSWRSGIVAEFDYFAIEREFLISDINQDTIVNLIDYTMVASNWLKYSPFVCDPADISEDGNVDMDDVAQIVINWLEN